jgi:hypothetical protein
LRIVNRLPRVIFTALALTLLSVAAQVATVTFKANLKASSEVPPNDSAGIGTLSATLNTETNEFKYHIEFSGLSGPVAAAHFHGPAAEGTNAKPRLPITTDLVSPIDGSATLTPEQSKELTDGQWYFNLHTSANPRGEVRGQIMKAK